MSVTTISIDQTSATQTATRPVWKVAAGATVVAAVATELFTLVARALDVPMRAADPGASAAKDIAVGGFAGAVLFWGLIGIALAVVLARKAKAPARTYAVTTITLTALSLLGPVFAAHTELSTKIVLLVAHVIAAAVVIPPVTARLRDVER